jgi:basic membrane protein A
VGQLKDKSFNQGTWEGVKRYASENGKAYKYYQPANGDAATDDDRYDAMKFAVEGGAEIVVCAGFLQASALEKAAKEFTETKFVFIDGWATGIANIMSIDFQEEQSGYLAGYAAVKEGFTKLGFSGGGGGANPACCRFGYGYVQGAQAAAAELGVNVEMKYSWAYGSSFGASPELQTMLDGWYVSGTEVIFACGGSMCQSAFAAAGANDGYVIGVDVDQSAQSEYVITSAAKGLREAVMHACDVFYSGEWDTVGGNCTTMGAAMDAVGLPTATWSLVNFTIADYEDLFASLKDGSVVVDKDYANGLKAENFSNVTLDIIE